MTPQQPHPNNSSPLQLLVPPTLASTSNVICTATYCLHTCRFRNLSSATTHRNNRPSPQATTLVILAIFTATALPRVQAKRSSCAQRDLSHLSHSQGRSIGFINEGGCQRRHSPQTYPIQRPSQSPIFRTFMRCCSLAAMLLLRGETATGNQQRCHLVGVPVL